MALSLGFTLAALWAGPVLDSFGVRGLLGTAFALGAVSVVGVFVLGRGVRPEAELSGAPP